MSFNYILVKKIHLSSTNPNHFYSKVLVSSLYTRRFAKELFSCYISKNLYRLHIKYLRPSGAGKGHREFTEAVFFILKTVRCVRVKIFFTNTLLFFNQLGTASPQKTLLCHYIALTEKRERGGD